MSDNPTEEQAQDLNISQNKISKWLMNMLKDVQLCYSSRKLKLKTKAFHKISTKMAKCKRDNTKCW